MIKMRSLEMHETPYNESKPKKKHKLYGYCSSFKCVFQERGKEVDKGEGNWRMVSTNVHDVYCGHCGNAIYWSKRIK